MPQGLIASLNPRVLLGCSEDVHWVAENSQVNWERILFQAHRSTQFISSRVVKLKVSIHDNTHAQCLKQQAESLHLKLQAESQEKAGNDATCWPLEALPQWHDSSAGPQFSKLPKQCHLPQLSTASSNARNYGERYIQTTLATHLPAKLGVAFVCSIH